MKVKMTKEEYKNCKYALETMKDDALPFRVRLKAKNTFDQIYSNAEKRTHAEIIKNLKG